MDGALSSEVLVHLTSLRNEFLRYFPEISQSDLKLVRKLFAVQKKFAMAYRMNSLTLKMILLIEICSGQRHTFLTCV